MMTNEEKKMLEEYRIESEKCYPIALLLDSLNPEMPGAFTGSPSERIERHVKEFLKK